MVTAYKQPSRRDAISYGMQVSLAVEENIDGILIVDAASIVGRNLCRADRRERRLLREERESTDRIERLVREGASRESILAEIAHNKRLDEELRRHDEHENVRHVAVVDWLGDSRENRLAINRILEGKTRTAESSSQLSAAR